MATNKAIFERCTAKILEIERWLTRSPHYPLGNTHTPRYSEGASPPITEIASRRGLYFGKQIEEKQCMAINFQFMSVAAHSLIIVRDSRLVHSTQYPGFSIFDPNGKERLPINITDRSEDGSEKVINKELMEISPDSSINIGTDAINPGYCATFGIIFMCYYHRYKDYPNWLSGWKYVLGIFKTESTRWRGRVANIGIEVAADVLQEICKGSSVSENIEGILEVLCTACPDIITAMGSSSGGGINYSYKTDKYMQRLEALLKKQI